MIKQLTTSYENMGTSSYLTVTFTPEAGLVNYQLEMLTANEIDHILPVSKRMKNGETVAYYNITSKIALSQILGRKKLSRKELIKLIEGAVKATKDAGEYQLPASGIVMDPEFIFVDPANCNPGFIFLPVVNNSAKTLRDLILELIMQGKIEMSNDNFVQVLLETVNSQPLSLDKLEACLATYKDGKAQTTGGNLNAQKPAAPIYAAEPVKTIEPVKMPDPTPVKVDEPAVEVNEAPVRSGMGSKMPSLPGKKDADKKPVPTGKDKKKPAKEKKAKEKPVKEKAEGDVDSGAAKKKFLLPQALILVVLAAAYSFNLFVDETGAISVTNIAAILGCIALVEFVLYREAFVNGKAPKEKKTKEKSGKAPKTPKGPKAPTAPVKSAELPKPAVPTMKKPETPVQKPVVETAPVEPVQNIPVTPVYSAPQKVQVPTYSSDTVIAGETEIWDGEQGGMTAYLEYYENGMMNRIPLDKPSTLLGRLSGQVDFAVSNPKVGKVHAEIVNDNGLFYIKDLSSKNGTYINDKHERINSNVLYPLNNQDKIKLADSEFTFRRS